MGLRAWIPKQALGSLPNAQTGSVLRSSYQGCLRFVPESAFGAYLGVHMGSLKTVDLQKPSLSLPLFPLVFWGSLGVLRPGSL